MADIFYRSLLERRKFLGMQFAQGWLFGQVVACEDVAVPYERYNPLAAGTSLATIGGLTDNWLQWLDAQNHDIFRERDSDKLLQAFVGIYPPRLRLWKQFPAPMSRGNLYEIKVPSALAAASCGYIEGSWSPYGEPTSLTELFVPPELIVKWGVFNPETVTVSPRFTVFIRRLQMKYLNPGNADDSAAIDAILKNKIYCKMWSPGLDPFEYDVEDRLGIKASSLTPSAQVLKGAKEGEYDDEQVLA